MAIERPDLLYRTDESNGLVSATAHAGASEQR